MHYPPPHALITPFLTPCQTHFLSLKEWQVVNFAKCALPAIAKIINNALKILRPCRKIEAIYFYVFKSFVPTNTKYFQTKPESSLTFALTRNLKIYSALYIFLCKTN